MTKKISNSIESIESIESFNRSYIEFWSHQVAAQIYNQEFGVLSEKIRHSMGDERSELEARRKAIEEKYTAEIKHIFPLLKKMASRDGELAVECYETLKSSSSSIVINYTRLISLTPELRDIFLNCYGG
ncbi:MAG: hypothetical protein IKP68_05580 [Clostridia bacterium]|nr:hypothetical protein [Clostridia bacterium]